MALDKLVDSSQLDTDLTSVANAIRTKGGTSAQLAFPAGFVSAIGAIPTGGTPTGTKQISITANGTTTEDVAAYANAEITVSVPGGGGSATHVQYTAARDATSTSAGGNTSAFRSAYITPNIPSSGNVVLVCFITNNSASGNYARAWFYCRDTKLRGSALQAYWRGSSAVGASASTNTDFFYTSGSLIDVWVLTDPLPIT